jgi:hypothetical protein
MDETEEERRRRELEDEAEGRAIAGIDDGTARLEPVEISARPEAFRDESERLVREEAEPALSGLSSEQPIPAPAPGSQYLPPELRGATSSSVSPTFRMPPVDMHTLEGERRPGNIDLHNRPIVHNDDDSFSTVRSASFGTDEGEVLLPTVSDDGAVMSDADAFGEYERSGRHLGVYDTPEDATRAAGRLHDSQAEEYGPQARLESGAEEPAASPEGDAADDAALASLAGEEEPGAFEVDPITSAPIPPEEAPSSPAAPQPLAPSSPPAPPQPLAPSSDADAAALDSLAGEEPAAVAPEGTQEEQADAAALDSLAGVSKPKPAAAPYEGPMIPDEGDIGEARARDAVGGVLGGIANAFRVAGGVAPVRGGERRTAQVLAQRERMLGEKRTTTAAQERRDATEAQRTRQAAQDARADRQLDMREAQATQASELAARRAGTQETLAQDRVATSSLARQRAEREQARDSLLDEREGPVAEEWQRLLGVRLAGLPASQRTAIEERMGGDAGIRQLTGREIQRYLEHGVLPEPPRMRGTGGGGAAPLRTPAGEPMTFDQFAEVYAQRTGGTREAARLVWDNPASRREFVGNLANVPTAAPAAQTRDFVGFTRDTGLTPLGTGQLADMRNAQASLGALDQMVQQLLESGQRIGAMERAGAAAGAIDRATADYLQAHEQATGLLRTIGNYGVPSDRELARMEALAPTLSSAAGIMSAQNMYRSLGSTMRRSFDARMGELGYRRDGAAGGASGGTRPGAAPGRGRRLRMTRPGGAPPVERSEQWLRDHGVIDAEGNLTELARETGVGVEGIR